MINFAATAPIEDRRGFWVRLAHGRARGPAATVARISLLPVALLYGLITRLRRAAYRRGLLRSHPAAASVVSVGNLTAGGTGKTPFVQWVARRLIESGARPAILSRGYGATGADRRNDEALMLEASLPGVAHYADPDRVRSAARAVEAGADCLVLDDGFQHIRLRRDLNIVLLDATDPFGGGRMLPAGLLREPLAALGDADAVILSHAESVVQAEREVTRIRLQRYFDGPVAEAHHRPVGVLTPDGEKPPDFLAGRRVFLLCGIARPEHFLQSAKDLAALPVGGRYLPDHVAYTDALLAELAEAAAESGAELALTTQKDAVKIADSWPGSVPLAVLKIEYYLSRGAGRIEELLQSRLKR